MRHGWRHLRQVAFFAALAASLLLIWVVTISGPVAPTDPAQPNWQASVVSAAADVAQPAGAGR